ncbi:uncharacterized protein OCT59_028072 [Rhizophagus irregularis]|uniref:uncharacterized protein n=1 Tax=Rhizophagus irregularis TaxID=588596 RepID=UPI003332802F|nr:hypothetical protein OCT59_028072 [Rhizophagus irregularis]
MKVLNLSESLLSNLLSDWEVLEPPVEDACTQLQWWVIMLLNLIVFQLDKKEMKKVVKTVIHHSVCGAINTSKMKTLSLTFHLLKS